MPENKTSRLFREKSIERVSSPEQLDDYIRVTHPGVWMILLAIIILLAGVIVWAAFGTVSFTDASGAVRQVNPISFVIN
ncbi:MAG: hypothetical protein IJT96_10905 [Lachnospiraceae bacterium]|nr:hypothetical protein [Lachnospiraceae bacterium]